MNLAQRQRILIAIICLGSLFLDNSANPGYQESLSKDLDEEVAALVRDGSPASIERLYELSRSGDRESFEKASPGIIQIAKRLLLAGNSRVQNNMPTIFG